MSGALKQEPATARSEASAGSLERMVRRYCDLDQARMDALPAGFWKAMKTLPAMRKATDAELRLMSWCEGVELLYGMTLCGHCVYDKWRLVLGNLRACNRRGEIHCGHVLAMVATRTPNELRSASALAERTPDAR